jgi:flagellar biogenesis protein FliO
MCAPVSIVTGGTVSGCTGVCQMMPQIFASLGIVGVLIWNFRDLIRKRLSFRKTSA